MPLYTPTIDGCLLRASQGGLPPSDSESAYMLAEAKSAFVDLFNNIERIAAALEQLAMVQTAKLDR